MLDWPLSATQINVHTESEQASEKEREGEKEVYRKSDESSGVERSCLWAPDGTCALVLQLRYALVPG